MLSLNLIQGHFRERRFDALLRAITANGFDLPLPLQARLLQHPVAIIAMALRRLVELTYGPTALSREMTQFLLDRQASDGSFEHDPIATAAVIASLDHLLTEQPNLNDPAVPTALEQAVAALAGMQAEDGLFRGGNEGAGTDQDRALIAAFLLWLLSPSAEFRGAVRFADLMTWFEQRHESLEPETHRLWSLARVEALSPTPAQRPGREAAAIAA